MNIRQLLHHPKIQAAMVFEVGFWPIAGALIAQYGFDYPPCELCLYQRYPYIAIMVLAMLVFYKNASGGDQSISLSSRASYMFELAAWLCMLSALVGLFHAGVESGWWVYESSCVPEAGQAGSLDSLRDSIARAPLVSCDQAMVYVFGLSMAAWNVIYGVITAIGFMAMRNIVRKMP